MDYDFENVKELIIVLLENEERCRNDDTYLVLRVLQQFIDFKIPDYLGNIPSASTIIRQRARIQKEERRLLPTDDSVRVKRGIKPKFFASPTDSDEGV